MVHGLLGTRRQSRRWAADWGWRENQGSSAASRSLQPVPALADHPAPDPAVEIRVPQNQTVSRRFRILLWMITLLGFKKYVKNRLVHFYSHCTPKSDGTPCIRAVSVPLHKPAVLCLGVYLRQLETNVSPHTCAWKTELAIIARSCKLSKCPSTSEWINKMWYIHIME